MTDASRPRRREVPAVVREPTTEDKRLVTRLPHDLVRRLNRILDQHQGHDGPGRVITIALALEDVGGLVGTLGTYVMPPKEWARPESA
jgi:hypothetical protein